MQINQVPFTETGYLNTLMTDYVSENKNVQPFYHRFPSIASAEAQMKEKQESGVTRSVLVEALKAQYKNLSQFSHKERVEENIDKLKNASAFTVTTGHQLCLFTGPLYFIYKIANAINMAKELAENYPQNQFVPVFWMASEDHDFEEINHIHFKSHKISWHREMGGAVGRMEVESCEKALKTLSMHLPDGKRGAYLTNLFAKAYQQKNLAEATRFLVNELFGQYGVVILDGDDAKLKKLVAPYFKRELLEGIGEKYVTESSEKLGALNYKIQVNPRDVNLFYLLDDFRERITRKENGFATSDGKYQFTKEEIIAELEKHPERFSPNVILRPLYQEVILPNLAYIGGGGELAYWLEMKYMFEAFDVPFPMLRLRNSVGVTPRAISRKIEKLEFGAKDLFQSFHDLSTALVKRNSDIDNQFKNIRDDWKVSLEKWNAFTSDFDPTLSSSVEAERARILKGLMRLEKKVIRNKKRHEGDKLRMLQEVKNELFPGNGLQERKDNFCKMYLAFGEDFVPQVLASTRPFENEFTLMHE